MQVLKLEEKIVLN